MTLLTSLPIWAGILFCILQSGIFSGLNLACFTISRLELEIEARKGSTDARRVLALRRDSNFLLVTILWGNVAINVLLALLSNSVMTGVAAFLFSTVAITIFGEIMPQAWFSRRALRVAALFAPVLRFYQILLYPVARPTALALDLWLGREPLRYISEHSIKQILHMQLESGQSDISRVEGLGAINFLTIDDEPLGREGEPILPETVLRLPFVNDRPVFPPFRRATDDPFLRQINQGAGKWTIIVDETDAPRLAFNTDEMLRAALFGEDDFDPQALCHRPIIAREGETRLDRVIERLCAGRRSWEDRAIARDLILLWGKERRVITGADLLGRLLRGLGPEPAQHSSATM